jgi:Fe_only_hydrog: hydrogenases, Fe-only
MRYALWLWLRCRRYLRCDRRRYRSNASPPCWWP